MSPAQGAPLRTPALAVAGGALALLLGVVALVLWRGREAAAAGGWSAALAVTGVVAVVGLLAAAALAASVALAPPRPDEVVVRVPAEGPASAEVEPSPVPARRVRAATALGLLAALPVLVVLVLAGSGAGDRTVPAGATGPAATGDAPPEPSAPGPSEPSAPSAPPPAPEAEAPDPAPPPAPAPPAPQPGPAEPGPSAPEAEAPDPAPPGAGPPADAGGAVPTATCQRVVVEGDSLWRIAEDQLGGAPVAEVAAAVHTLYGANTAVVGADPDLIHPGDVLDTCP